MCGMAEVRWNPEVPDDVRRAFEPHLLRWFAFVPRWCHEVLIGWTSDDGDYDIQTETHYEYRWFKMTIRPSFLNRSQVERSNEVLHELLHAALIPHLAPSGDLLDFVKEKYPEVFPWAKEMRRAGMEATICDLTDSIMRHAERPA